jgi:hypothetical protein
MEPGHRGNLGKTSITEVYILNHLMYKGQPVTKVLMKPLTGRRHQLRIHSLCLGHPIVGDYTYNAYHRKLIHEVCGDQQGLGEEVNMAMRQRREGSEENENLLADRMMLHAHRLMIPFPTVGKCTEAFRQSLIDKYLARKDKDGCNNSITHGSLLSEKEKQSILSETPLVQAQAPDPFVVCDNQLIVSL